MKNATDESISRLQFLKKLGLGGASLMAFYCVGTTLNSCSVAQVSGTPDDFVLDLKKSRFKSLLQTGGWTKVNNVVVACTAPGQYVAVTSICSHEGENRVEFRPAEKDFRCTAHGAEFDVTGVGKNKKGRKGLQVYSISKEGDTLRVQRPVEQKS
jgi:cytochrome b6-f complex iron-sulfur subunit